MSLRTKNLFFTPVRGKRPFLDDWQNTKLTFSQAKKYPCTGIGIVHGLSGTCCLDIDDITKTAEFLNQFGFSIEELKKDNFVITSPKKSSDKILFKIPEGVELKHIDFSDDKGKFLELRANEHQDVWPKSEYHFNGKGFDEWENTFYGHSGSEEIKELPPKLCAFWQEKQSDIDTPKKSGKVNVNKGVKRKSGTINELIDTLMTGKPGLHDAIRDYSWGQIQDGVNPGVVIKAIQQMMSAIPKELLRYYDDVPRIVNGGVEYNIPIEPKEKKKTKRHDIPWPPGNMGILARSAYNAQRYKSKPIAIITALATVAGIVGRRYNINGTGLNIYITLLADTGTGKDAIDDFVNHIYYSLGIGDTFKGPKRFTGPKALIMYLHKHRCALSVFTEAGILFKSEAGDTAGLLRVLLGLYTKSGQNQFFSGENYSSKDDSLPTLGSPAFSLVNEATPVTFATELRKRKSIDTGELPRMHIFNVNDIRPYESRDAEFAVPEDIMNALDILGKFCAATQDDLVGEPIEIAVPDQYYEFSDYCTDQFNQLKLDDPLQAGMYSRAALKQLRTVGLMAAFEGVKEVTEEMWEWGVIFHKYEFSGLSSFFEGSSDDIENIARELVGNTIAKILTGKYKDRKILPNETMRKAGQFTASNLSQALKNNAVLTSMDDPGTRGQTRTGLTKMIGILMDLGWIFNPRNVVGSPKNTGKVYQITDDFRRHFEYEQKP